MAWEGLGSFKVKVFVNSDHYGLLYQLSYSTFFLQKDGALLRSLNFGSCGMKSYYCWDLEETSEGMSASETC